MVKIQQLRSNEFLNLDAILEDVLVRLVVRPLWAHINQLYVEALTAAEQVQNLAKGIAIARDMPTEKLGMKVSFNLKQVS